MKHTPGPWRFELRGMIENALGGWIATSLDILDADGELVARIPGPIGDPQGERDHADARLIAAAPDMLAACEALVLADEIGNPTDATLILEEALGKARAAIAKARGES